MTLKKYLALSYWGNSSGPDKCVPRSGKECNKGSNRGAVTKGDWAMQRAMMNQISHRVTTLNFRSPVLQALETTKWHLGWRLIENWPNTAWKGNLSQNVRTSTALRPRAALPVIHFDWAQRESATNVNLGSWEKNERARSLHNSDKSLFRSTRWDPNKVIPKWFLKLA